MLIYQNVLESSTLQPNLKNIDGDKHKVEIEKIDSVLFQTRNVAEANNVIWLSAVLAGDRVG